MKKIEIKPFGERLRTVVDALDLIKTTKTIVLMVHLNFESKRATSFIRYNGNWSQFMIDDLF